MKSSFSATSFLGGTLCGLVLALCVAAVQNPNAPVTNPPPAPPIQAASAWADLKFVAYPNGATGIFDPATGMLYLYDSELNRCYQTRKLRALGDYMQRW